MTYQRRPGLSARVDELASLVVLRRFGGEMLGYAARLDQSPDPLNRAAAAQLREAIAQMQECVRHWRARQGEGSEVGTSEPSEPEPAAESVVSSSAGLTTREVADRLRVSQRRVVALADSGRLLSATRSGPGRSWLIPEASVTEYQQTRRRR